MLMYKMPFRRRAPFKKKPPYKKRKFKRKVYKKKPRASRFMKITKCHRVQGVDHVMPFGMSSDGLTTNQHWYIQPLAQLDRHYTAAGGNVAAYADDKTNRESSRIFHKNTTINLDIVPNTINITPFAYRVAMGYFKGSRIEGTQELRVPDMVTMFPDMRTPLKNGYSGNQESSRFYWTYVSKPTTVTPKQIYDANGSDDTMGPESLSALWVPQSRTYKFKANRIRTYAGDAGNTLEGWTPIFCIQCMPLVGQTSFTHPNIHTDVTGNVGSTPCPMLQLNVKTYFQDIH